MRFTDVKKNGNSYCNQRDKRNEKVKTVKTNYWCKKLYQQKNNPRYKGKQTDLNAAAVIPLRKTCLS